MSADRVAAGSPCRSRLRTALFLLQADDLAGVQPVDVDRCALERDSSQKGGRTGWVRITGCTVSMGSRMYLSRWSCTAAWENPEWVASLPWRNARKLGESALYAAVVDRYRVSPPDAGTSRLRKMVVPMPLLHRGQSRGHDPGHDSSIRAHSHLVAHVRVPLDAADVVLDLVVDRPGPGAYASVSGARMRAGGGIRAYTKSRYTGSSSG
ncbi:hypothetical protein VTK73DRAFT_4307 [Phialemonium thermophilum]|uniref:Uncharacterized protein n=1 Tax=Phialemonium thermophilum TaxID=223376 RepID=A0ABR3V9X2_9PEZI